MTKNDQVLMSFSRFSDQQWSALCGHLPKALPANFNLEAMRFGIEATLSSFCARRNFPPGTHAVTVDDKGHVVRFDLAEKHRRIASTAQAFVEAYDPSYNLDENLKPADDNDGLIKQLSKIAKSHARAARKLEKESPSPKRRGTKADEAIRYLIYNLIRNWEGAGGEITTSRHGSYGGPLNRFLAEATKSVMPNEPTKETIVYWIRGFKRRHPDKIPSRAN